MAFVLNPTRKFTVKYKDPKTEDEFEADYEFILTEDCFTDELRKKTQEIEPILDSDSDEVKKNKLFRAQSVVWHKIRRSLKVVRGINDEEGNPLIVNEENQAAIFEFITNFGDTATQVLMSYIGLSSKNLKAGVTK